ncbi:MAG: outer membrane beta-barrel protein [Chitinophagaceae bacterium]|nr:outer membrane beta-barrel protein [Chitinophagaceae bacterium]MBK8606557.1 outer membrane beta-barrel protein [Chitinophagaceae bacterium]MBP6476143.1 outer membrane beta-barrel protein [Chitinophagaceae bacterium]MBP7107224.1 outer membrane beta-barrel protein [Chitinophagaceae bacterium]MBP7313574.1 outer membrane beta-barrel protein [Chitinophagaceae bacterium]
MKKIIGNILALAVLICSCSQLKAQESVVQEGEFGIGLGSGHYFGDLNTRASLNRPKMAASVFFRKNLGNYIAVRLGASYAQLGYSDKYNDFNKQMFTRNLSFNSNVWELSLQGDFNFFRFMPGEPDYSFTPYITFGAGIFTYDPYAYLRDEKILLRPLNTEGQGSTLYPDRKPYSSMAISIPFGGGIKYAFNDRINIGFEVLYRFTNTDYLDDVSTTYVDQAVFPPNPDGSPSNALLLSDRSYELGAPIGIPNRQRGNSKQNDHFVTAMFHVTFNLQSYKCPTAN